MRCFFFVLDTTVSDLAVGVSLQERQIPESVGFSRWMRLWYPTFSSTIGWSRAFGAGRARRAGLPSWDPARFGAVSKSKVCAR